MLKIFSTRMYFLVDIYHWEIFTGRWKNSDKFSEVTDAYFENVENLKIFVQNGMRCRIHIFFSLVWFEPIFRFYAPQTSNETERGFKDDFNKIQKNGHESATFTKEKDFVEKWVPNKLCPSQNLHQHTGPKWPFICLEDFIC